MEFRVPLPMTAYVERVDGALSGAAEEEEGGHVISSPSSSTVPSSSPAAHHWPMSQLA